MPSSYGSTKDELIEAQGQPEPSWTFRGKVIGIMLDLCSVFSINATLTLIMFNGMMRGYRLIMHCEWGAGSAFNLSLAQTLTCEYTKGYVRCFPSLALALLLLRSSINILQTRFYYGLLAAGGALNYSGRPYVSGWRRALKDPYVLLTLWCYVHILLHAAFLASMIEFKTSVVVVHSAVHEHLGTSGNKQDVQRGSRQELELEASDMEQLPSALFDLTMFVVIPSTLFVCFLLQSYDLEQRMVPLSEFIEGKEDVLKQVVVVDESTLKTIMKKHGSELTKTQDSVEEQYLAVLNLYKTHRSKFSGSPPPLVKMMGSLWPAEIVLQESHGYSLNNFRGLWLVAFSTAVLLQVIIVRFLIIQAVHAYYEFSFFPMHLLELGVEMLHLLIVASILWPLLRATSHIFIRYEDS